MDPYMQIAVDEAKAAQAEGNYPYGSVLVRSTEIIVGASWEGCEASHIFMESNGVKITVLELEECRELLRNSG